jgi:hypothetical protein
MTTPCQDDNTFDAGFSAGWDAALCWAGILPEDRPALAAVLPLPEEEQ